MKALLAAIGTIESDNDQFTLPGVHSGAMRPPSEKAYEQSPLTRDLPCSGGPGMTLTLSSHLHG